MTDEEIAEEERIAAGIMRDQSHEIILVDTGWMDRDEVLRLIELLQAEVKRMRRLDRVNGAKLLEVLK